MRLDRRPLLNVTTDAALFVDRVGPTQRLMGAVTMGFNVLVTGEPGIGRTSLLRHIAWQLREQEAPVFVSGASAATPVEALQRLCAELGLEASATELPDTHELLMSLNAFLHQSARAGPRLVVIFDDAHPKLWGLFGALRDELWELPITWLVSCTDDAAPTLLRPPANTFFEVVVDLPPFSLEDAAELLQRRLDASADGLGGLSPSDIDALAETSRGHPSLLLDLARAAVVDGEAVSQLRVGLSSVDSRLGSLSRQATMLAGELKQMGPASASDQRLMDRMGVSRPRLAQLLKELVTAGVATETSERARGPGRPRLLYTVIEPMGERAR